MHPPPGSGGRKTISAATYPGKCLPCRKKLFTHTGSLGYIYNMRYWMEVAHALQQFDPEETIHFVFIGDGVQWDELEVLKQEWNLNRVHFLGLT